MNPTAEYYRKVRGMIWPLLVQRTAMDCPISPQMMTRAKEHQRVAKQLLRLPTEGAPATLVRHVEAWAKHLQVAPAFYEEAESLAYYDPPEVSEESKEPGLLGMIAGTILLLAASKTMEGIEKSSRRQKIRLSTQIAAYEKRAGKRMDERDRLEATLERLGADNVQGFRRRDFHWLQRWTGEVKLLPDETVLGPGDEEIERQLRSLPNQGKGLSNVEIYPTSEEYLVVYVISRDRFGFGRLERNANLFTESVEPASLSRAVDFAIRYCEAPEDWEGMIEWKVS